MEQKNRYPIFSLRVDIKTWELFKEKRKQSGLSVNRYLYYLLTKYED